MYRPFTILMRKSVFLVIMLISVNLLMIGLPTTQADNQISTATSISHLDTQQNWICNPDCDSEPIDEYDWYVTVLNPYDTGQVFVENTGQFSSVKLIISIYQGNENNLVTDFEVNDGDNESVLFSSEQLTSEQFFISITTEDGFSADGTYYSIFVVHQSDNHWTNSNEIIVGSFVDENTVCIDDCPGEIIDAEDWYHFTAEAGQSIGIVAEELTWFTYLDFELFTVNAGQLVTLPHEYHGGSAGGPQDYSVRAWFNTTETTDVYIKVYTDEADDTLYNLSVSSGTWVDVVEDNYHWVAFPDLNLGDEIRVQVIRTNEPNDLDILLYNSSEFENYRNEVVNNETSSPSELLAVEDCLVCSISFTLTDDKSGLMNAKPHHTHDIFQTISWSPTLFLVADYTDYLKNPPANSVTDTASVFLSISVLDSDIVAESYEVYYNDSSEWVMIDSGLTTEGMVNPPISGWNTSQTTSNPEETSTIYRLIVRNSVTNNIVSDSTFEVTNYRPTACFDIGGELNGLLTENVPIVLDARCSNDADNDELSYQWEIEGIEVSSNSFFELSLQQGTHQISLHVSDSIGLTDSKFTQVQVYAFPYDEYQNQNYANFSNYNSTKIEVENTHYENSSVAPQWLNFGIIGTEIGIGLNIETRITQITEYDLSITNLNNISTIQITNESTLTETAMKVNLALFIVDMDSGNETIYDLPMPMQTPLYDGQPWIPVGLFDRVYYWGDLAVVDSHGPSTDMNNNVSLYFDIPTLDLMDYINSLAGNIPGSQIPLLTLGIAIDYNLYLDIDLQLEISNSGTLSHLIFSETSDNSLQLNEPINQEIGQLVDYYSYSTLTSENDIFGSIGLRLRIAQPGWLTTGLGFFYEDPMFLEGIWEYTITESDGPLASSLGKSSSLASTSVIFNVVDQIDDSVEDIPDNTSEPNDDVDDETNETDSGLPSDNSNSTTNDDNDGSQDNKADTDEKESAVLSESAIQIATAVVLIIVILFLISLIRRRR